MKTITKQRTLQESLLDEAFKALLEKLGYKKATKVWQVLVPSHTNYLDIRSKLFEGKDEDTLDKEIMEFSRKRKREGNAQRKQLKEV